jgi:hypothetical protein
MWRLAPVGRDGRDFPVFGFDLPCPVLLVFQREVTRDLFQGHIAGKIDDVLDRCPLGLPPGRSLVRRLVELGIVGNLAQIHLEGIRDRDRGLRRPTQQSLSIPFPRNLSRSGLCVDCKQSGERFFQRCLSGKMIDRLVGEPAGQRLDRGHPVATTYRVRDIAVRCRTRFLCNLERGSVVIVGLSQQVPFKPRLLHAGRAKRLLDSPARIEVTAPRRDPAIVPPDPASALEVRIVFDALHAREIT